MQHCSGIYFWRNMNAVWTSLWCIVIWIKHMPTLLDRLLFSWEVLLTAKVLLQIKWNSKKMFLNYFITQNNRAEMSQWVLSMVWITASSKRKLSRCWAKLCWKHGALTAVIAFCMCKLLLLLKLIGICKNYQKSNSPTLHSLVRR